MEEVVDYVAKHVGRSWETRDMKSNEALCMPTSARLVDRFRNERFPTAMQVVNLGHCSPSQRQWRKWQRGHGASLEAIQPLHCPKHESLKKTLGC